MSAVTFGGNDYPAPVVAVQNDPAATSLDATKVPTGQTIDGYLNNNLLYEEVVTLYDTHKATFRLYSNGVKSMHIADGGVDGSSHACTGVIPARYRPVCKVRTIGGNSIDTSNIPRFISIETDGSVNIWSSSANGMYMTTFYM